MNKYATTLVLALAAAQTLHAQDVTTQQDSLLTMMNDSAYWKNIDLDEAVVKSTLPKTRVKGDAMRTIVSGSILEKAGTLTDVLGKIPTLKAEKGSGVEVFGRGAAEVYINGRKVMDMNELDRLRSEDIQSVDVISNPGARYAAETKAVVRITMKRRQGEGFSFVDYASGIYRYGASAADNLDMNYRTGGLDVTASFWGGHYGHNRSNQSNDITYLVRRDSAEPVEWDRYVGRSKQDSKYKWNGYSPQLQLNYVLSENHSFGAFYKWDHNTKNEHSGWFNMDNYKNDVFEEAMFSELDGDDGQKKHIFNAYYNGKVHNLSIDWNLDGLFSNQDGWSETTEMTTNTAPLSPMPPVGGIVTGGVGVKTFSETSNDFWATKLILSYPVWKGNLSAGGEYTHNSRTSAYTVNTEAQVATSNSDIDIRETSTSGFVEYGRTFKTLFVQAGLRYEHIANDYYLYDVRQDDTSRSYGDWFPTATLAYRTPHQVQLSLSYRKDIRRPAYDNLGSSIMYINKYSYQGGNPYLQPVYTHNLTLNAAYRWANAMVNFQRIKNDIVLQTKPFPGSTDPMVSLILPENSAEAYNRLFLSLSARPVIGLWHPAWTASLSLQNYKTLTLDPSTSSGQTTITLNHPYAWFVWDNDFILPHDWRINAQLQYGTKGDYMTYRMITHNWNSNIGIQKDLATRRCGKFNFDIRCYDPFNIAKTGTIVYGLRQIEAHNPARRTIMLDVTWRFNEAQKKYRGSGAGQSQKDRM